MSGSPMHVDEISTERRSVAVVSPDVQGLDLFERLARDPNVSVEKIERLVALWERAEARKAEIAFSEAMSKAQKAIKPVLTDDYNTHTQSRYATYEALDAEARPVYTRHGFGLSFDTADSPLPEHVRILCYVSHHRGHSRTYHVDMPADGKGARGGDVMTKTHAAGSAMTYGQRYLLKLIFNLAIRDDDGNAASPKRQEDIPKAPDGFTKWFAQLDELAGKGLKAFEPAWECSDGHLKQYAHKYHRAELRALKEKAAKAGKA